MAEREYKDSEGNVVTLDKLVRIEPEWAVNIIRWYEGKLDRCEELLATAYQLAGLVGAPERFLDAYSRQEGDIDSLLPVELSELDEFKELSSRLDSAENAMREVVSHLQRSQRGSTHWAGCSDVHPVCQAIDMLVDALPSRDVEKLRPKSQSHGVNDVNLEPKMHDYPMAFQDMIAALMRHHSDEEIARMFANYADMGAQYGDSEKWAHRAAAWHDAAERRRYLPRLEIKDGPHRIELTGECNG